MNIKDIARKAGVSTATVSRVVNNSPLVKKATKERVLKFIQKYDYQLNFTAQSLVKGKSNLLALIVPPESSFFSGFYFRQLFCGITDTLSKHRYRLMIHQSGEYDLQTGYSPDLEGFNADGLFIISPATQDRLVRYLESKNRPAVLINARSKRLDWVDLNNIQITAEVIERLARLGHRRIGFIGGIINNFNAIDRLKGYRLGLERLQIPFDPGLVINGGYVIDGGYEAAKQLMALRRPPTALFAANDMMAIGVIRAILELGLSAPENISVFGFDDADVATISNPPLSTVSQPFYDMGRIAAETLIARVENSGVTQKRIELPGEIIMRASCGALKSLQVSENKFELA